MASGFGYGERFKAPVNQTPGPGAYDPKALAQVGFKPDPRSSFLGGQRFSQELFLSQDISSDAKPLSPHFRPKSVQEIKQDGNTTTRKYSWATRRIHELESDLQRVTDRSKKLEQELTARQQLAADGDGLVQMNEDLQAELTQARAQLEKLTQDKSDLIDALNNLERQLNNKQSSIDELAKKGHKLQVLLQNANYTIHQKDIAIGNMKQELDDVRKQLQQEVTARGRCLDECEALISECRGKEAIISRLTSAAEEQQSSLQASRSNSGFLEQQLFEAQQQCAELEKQVKVLQAAAEQQVEINNQMAASLSCKHLESQSASAMVTTLQDELKQLRTEALQAGERARNLQQSKDQQDKLSKQVEQLTKELEALKAASSTSLGDLSAARSRISDLQRDLDSVTAKLASTESDLALVKEDLSQTIEAHGASLSELEQARKEQQQLEQELAAVHMEAQRLSQQLQNSNSDYMQLVEQLASSKTEGNVLAEQAQNLATDLQSKMGTIMQYENDMQRLQEQLSKAHADLSAAGDSKSDLQSHLDELQGLYTQMQVDMVNENQKVKQLQAELDSVKSFLRYASDETTSMREENYALSTEVDKLSAALAAKDVAEMQHGEVESMQHELAEVCEQLAASEERVQLLEAEVRQLQQEARREELREKSTDQQVAHLQTVVQQALDRAEAAEKDSEASRKQAHAAETMVIEMNRLAQENEMMADRLQKLEQDLKELLGSGINGLGHNNPKQKIQYHLRLKQELEELRHECTLLLRDKFHLEQCVRYLVVKARLNLHSTDRPSAKRPLDHVQPLSLAPNQVYSTPTAQKTAKDRARSKQSEAGVVSKEELTAAIEHTSRKTAEELESWKASSKSPSHSASPASSNSGTHSNSPLNGTPTPIPSGLTSPFATRSPPSTSQRSLVEERILSRISAVCTPNGTRKHASQPLTHPTLSHSHSGSLPRSSPGAASNGSGSSNSPNNPHHAASTTSSRGHGRSNLSVSTSAELPVRLHARSSLSTSTSSELPTMHSRSARLSAVEERGGSARFSKGPITSQSLTLHRKLTKSISSK